MAGRPVRQPYARVDYVSQSGTKNLVTVLVAHFHLLSKANEMSRSSVKRQFYSGADRERRLVCFALQIKLSKNCYQILNFWLGDLLESGIGLSYCPASSWQAGTTPYARVDYNLQSETKNLAKGLYAKRVNTYLLPIIKLFILSQTVLPKN